MPIVAPDPVGSFIAGRRARQEEDYGETRNALARMEAEQAPIDYANRNRMADMQAQRFTAEEAQQKLTQGKAAAEYIARHPQAKAFAAGQFPEFVKLAQQATGKPWDALTDQEVQAFAGDFAQQAAAKLGMSPEKAAAYTLKPGETRYAGDNKPIVTAPAKADGDAGFTLSPGQTRFGPDGKPIANVAPTPPQADPKVQFAQADKLRDEFNNQSKEFVGVANSYQRILDSAADPSPAGDLSLIFNYMKVLDPGSTVREGEFAQAANAGSVPTQIIAQYNKVLNGERLAPEQRKDFVNRAERLYKGQETRWTKNIKGRYEKLARDLKVDPSYVVGELGVPDQAPPQQQAPPEAINYLRQNPQLKEAFKAKYGYVPDGI
jgi:hypothetical protein